VPAGSLCGMLGPSGCGKSSLFDVLCGVADMTRVHGRVTSQVGRERERERERESSRWVERERELKEHQQSVDGRGGI
jgi:ABC-type transport system involved in cytochrome bd biosynthesis fused ATPase/permease subunit